MGTLSDRSGRGEIYKMDAPTAMMMETQQYLEKIQAIAEATSPTRSIPTSRKSSLVSAFAATTISDSTSPPVTADIGKPFMSSVERSQESHQEERQAQEPTAPAREQEQEQQQRSEEEQLKRGELLVEFDEEQARARLMPGDGSSSSNQGSSSTTEMSDTKLSRFYRVLGESESSNAERREQEERARREAEERARRQQSEGK